VPPSDGTAADPLISMFAAMPVLVMVIGKITPGFPVRQFPFG
jgi:hypothetical protein